MFGVKSISENMNTHSDKKYEHISPSTSRYSEITDALKSSSSRNITNKEFEFGTTNSDVSVSEVIMRYSHLDDGLSSNHPYHCEQPPMHVYPVSNNGLRYNYQPNLTRIRRDKNCYARLDKHEKNTQITSRISRNNKNTKPKPLFSSMKTDDKATYCKPVVNLLSKNFVNHMLQRNSRLQNLFLRLVRARQKEKEKELSHKLRHIDIHHEPPLRVQHQECDTESLIENNSKIKELEDLEEQYICYLESIKKEMSRASRYEKSPKHMEGSHRSTVDVYYEGEFIPNNPYKRRYNRLKKMTHNVQRDSKIDSFVEDSIDQTDFYKSQHVHLDELHLGELQGQEEIVSLLTNNQSKQSDFSSLENVVKKHHLAISSILDKYTLHQNNLKKPSMDKKSVNFTKDSSDSTIPAKLSINNLPDLTLNKTNNLINESVQTIGSIFFSATEKCYKDETIETNAIEINKAAKSTLNPNDKQIETSKITYIDKEIEISPSHVDNNKTHNLMNSSVQTIASTFFSTAEICYKDEIIETNIESNHKARLLDMQIETSKIKCTDKEIEISPSLRVNNKTRNLTTSAIQTIASIFSNVKCNKDEKIETNVEFNMHKSVHMQNEPSNIDEELEISPNNICKQKTHNLINNAVQTLVTCYKDEKIETNIESNHKLMSVDIQVGTSKTKCIDREIDISPNLKDKNIETTADKTYNKKLSPIMSEVINKCKESELLSSSSNYNKPMYIKLDEIYDDNDRSIKTKTEFSDKNMENQALIVNNTSLTEANLYTKSNVANVVEVRVVREELNNTKNCETLNNIQSKLDTLMQSINSFMIELKGKKSHCRKHSFVVINEVDSRSKIAKNSSSQSQFVSKTNKKYDETVHEPTTESSQSTVDDAEDESNLSKSVDSIKYSHIIRKINSLLDELDGKYKKPRIGISKATRSTQDGILKKETSTEVQASRTRQIMNIAINTDPVGFLSLLRILLSYLPNLEKYSSFLSDTTASKKAAPKEPERTHFHHGLRGCFVRVVDQCLYRFKCVYCGQGFLRAYCCELHQYGCARTAGKKHDVHHSLIFLK